MIDYESFVQKTPPAASRDEWRRQLLALIAGERAEFLYLLLGLDEETLATRPLFDGQTLKDLLAHIASWDELYRERIALALSGRQEEIAAVDLDERNAAVRARRQAWTLSQALAAFTDGRQSFLEALAQVPDDQLHRPVAISGVDARPMSVWAVWRASHDAGHAADVRRWLNENDDHLEGDLGPKAVLAAALEASREEIGALAALVPEADRAGRPLEEAWTLKDVAGHLADWELFLLECLAVGRMLDMGYGGDVDRWNAAHAAARREQAWAHVWSDYRQARRQTVELVQGLEQEALAALLNNPWGKDTTTYRVVEWWLEHEREHAAGLRSALLDRGGAVEYKG